MSKQAIKTGACAYTTRNITSFYRTKNEWYKLTCSAGSDTLALLLVLALELGPSWFSLPPSGGGATCFLFVPWSRPTDGRLVSITDDIATAFEQKAVWQYRQTELNSYSSQYRTASFWKFSHVMCNRQSDWLAERIILHTSHTHVRARGRGRSSSSWHLWDPDLELTQYRCLSSRAWSRHTALTVRF